MPRLLLALLLVASPAFALRMAINPGALAQSCPVIVRGTIVSVDEPKETDGKKRPLATAAIEITEIVRNEFKDVPLKVGGTLRVKMAATRKPPKEGQVQAESSSSRDISYPVKTDGLWLVMLDKDNELRIDAHPEQRQPIDSKLNMLREMRDKKDQDNEFPNDPPGTVRGEVLKAEWHAERKKKAEVEKKREEKERKQDEADEKTARTVAVGLASATRINADSMKDHQALKVELRQRVLRTESEPKLSGDRLVAVVEYLLTHDPDTEVRADAAARLGHPDLNANARADELLLSALISAQMRVRLKACEALGRRGNPKHAQTVAGLLSDEERWVRRAAVEALGRFNDPKAVPALVKRWEKQKPEADDCWQWAETLAKLGEEELCAAAVVRAMDSDNENARYFALCVLKDMKDEAAIPAAVACLGRETQWILARGQNTGFDERIYKTAADLLAKRTGKKLGLDPVAWAHWWDAARKDYPDAPALTFDRDAAAKAFAASSKK